MSNVFERLAKDDDLTGVLLGDYEPRQLVAYVLKAYPGDPSGALKAMRDNHEIGSVNCNVALSLLEGYKGVKRN